MHLRPSHSASVIEPGCGRPRKGQRQPSARERVAFRRLCGLCVGLGRDSALFVAHPSSPTRRVLAPPSCLCARSYPARSAVDCGETMSSSTPWAMELPRGGTLPKGWASAESADIGRLRPNPGRSHQKLPGVNQTWPIEPGLDQVYQFRSAFGQFWAVFGQFWAVLHRSWGELAELGPTLINSGPDCIATTGRFCWAFCRLSGQGARWWPNPAEFGLHWPRTIE